MAQDQFLFCNLGRKESLLIPGLSGAQIWDQSVPKSKFNFFHFLGPIDPWLNDLY